MPKRVDHHQRRGELADALVRCARSRGLHAIGFREVAAEAGVSVNLVQYYFPTKADLLVGGLVRLRDLLRPRTEPGGSPADRIRAILRALLPTDETSTDLYRLHAAYAALAFTDPALAAQPHTAGPDQIQPVLAELIAEAAPAVDPELTATGLLALGTGLSAYLVSGYLDPAGALAALDTQLDRVLS